MKQDVISVCHFANAVAALYVHKISVQTGITTKKEVNKFIGNNG